MNADIQTSNFLNAIDRFGQSERDAINKELEDYKEQEFTLADRLGRRSKDSIISNELQNAKSKIITEYAFKEQDLRKSVFKRRLEIVDEIKSSVIEKLKAFQSTNDYVSYIEKSLDEVKNVVSDKAVIVYLSNLDKDKENIFKNKLQNVTFKEDANNNLGGFRVYCEELSILIDETFNTKLEDEIKNFISTSNLKVV